MNVCTEKNACIGNAMCNSTHFQVLASTLVLCRPLGRHDKHDAGQAFLSVLRVHFVKSAMAHLLRWVYLREERKCFLLTNLIAYRRMSCRFNTNLTFPKLPIPSRLTCMFRQPSIESWIRSLFATCLRVRRYTVLGVSIINSLEAQHDCE